MSKSQEHRIQIQAPITTKWLEELQPRQIRALASQYKVANATTEDIQRLQTDLLSIPAVRRLAGEPNGQEI